VSPSLSVYLSVCVCPCAVQRLAKFDSQDKTNFQGFRENLKSTGQSKFTIDEKEETGVTFFCFQLQSG